MTHPLFSYLLPLSCFLLLQLVIRWSILQGCERKWELCGMCLLPLVYLRGLRRVCHSCILQRGLLCLRIYLHLRYKTHFIYVFSFFLKKTSFLFVHCLHAFLLSFLFLLSCFLHIPPTLVLTATVDLYMISLLIIINIVSHLSLSPQALHWPLYPTCCVPVSPCLLPNCSLT